MGTQTDRLVVEFDANIKDYISKTGKITKKNDAISRSFGKVDRNIRKAETSLFKFSKVATAITAALSVGAFARFSDELQLAENQLKNVTSSTEQFVAVQGELNRIAFETRQSVAGLTSVFARFKRAGQEAGFTTSATLKLTEQLTKAFKLEGNSTREVNSVLLQLTQSFRKGRIDGEEFRAVSEGSTLVLQALSKELGVTAGQLKKLASEGKVTPEDLIQGLDKLAPRINSEFRKLEPTFAEAGTELGNVFAAAYTDSALDKILTNIKIFTIEGSKNLERLFSGRENESIDNLKAKIQATKDEIIRLRKVQEKSGLDYGMSLRRNASDLEDLELRLRSLQEAQKDSPLDVSITSGVEDPRIAQAQEFADAVKEIGITGLEDAEELFIKEVEIHKAALDQKLINTQQFTKMQEAAVKKLEKTKEGEVKRDKKLEIEKLNTRQTAIRAGMAINTLLFEDNKAIAAGLIIADTATGIQKSLAINPYDYANVALIAATGAANLVNALSASKGGGSISGTGGGGGSLPPQNFSPETSSLDLTTQDETSNQTIKVVFATDDGNDFFDMVGQNMLENNNQGRT